MLSPPPRIIPRLCSDICNRRNLHAVFPRRRTLHRQYIPNINSDLSLQPHRFPDLNFGKIRCLAGTFIKNNIAIPVGNTVAFIFCAAVNCVFVAVSPPKRSLYKAHAVKPEGIRACRLNHCGTRRLFIVRIVFTIPFLRQHRTNRLQTNEK